MMKLNDPDWWRHAVVYQVYPRSFADANGDGTGDIPGMIERLDYLAGLGVDAVWVSPWYPSPLLDGGYDVIDHRGISADFGTLADADAFIARAHELGLRVIIDLVPNHCSWEHPWFTAALTSPPGSPERALFHFLDGRGPDGAEPPNNWGSLFGGPAWTRTMDGDGVPGQWYLHLFDVSQPDWNWNDPRVADEFDSILRFWFDRGVDGFRIDVANAIAKADGLPDANLVGLELDAAEFDPVTGELLAGRAPSPISDTPGLEAIQRRWRSVADEYAHTPLGPRIFVAEAYLEPMSRLVRYVEPGRLHTTFNFEALLSEWSAASQRLVINRTLEAHHSVGAPPTWVLGNHDNTRVATRYGKAITGVNFTETLRAQDPIALTQQLHSLPTDVELGRRRARAAALLELALPGGAYIYQGEELGLGEVEDLPEDVLQDPTWERSGHQVRGRDGCRVPLPWSGEEPPFGFGPGGEPWLPQPAEWAGLTASDQAGDPDSTLSLYTTALQLRRDPAFRDGVFAWHDLDGADVIAFTRGGVVACIVNLGTEPVALPPGEVLVSSAATDGRTLPGDTAAWLRLC